MRFRITASIPSGLRLWNSSSNKNYSSIHTSLPDFSSYLMLSSSNTYSSEFLKFGHDSTSHPLAWTANSWVPLAIRGGSAIIEVVIFDFRFFKVWVKIFIWLLLISSLSFKIVELPFQLIRVVFLRIKLFANTVLSPTSKSQHQTESRFFLYIVFAKSMIQLQLLPSKGKSLPFNRDSFYVMNLHFHLLSRVRRANI